MQIQTVVKKYLLTAAACLFMLCAARSMQAQNIGPGNVELHIDNQSVYNGESNEVGPNVTLGTTLTGTISVNGVTGNRGTTYVSCYDSQAGLVFSWSTQVTAQANFQFTPGMLNGNGSHAMYCTADYTGEYANGDATTATLSFTVVR
jgi:hypothetical protein